jgi:hypothetical protein
MATALPLPGNHRRPAIVTSKRSPRLERRIERIVADAAVGLAWADASLAATILSAGVDSRAGQ